MSEYEVTQEDSDNAKKLSDMIEKELTSNKDFRKEIIAIITIGLLGTFKFRKKNPSSLEKLLVHSMTMIFVIVKNYLKMAKDFNFDGKLN